MVYEYSVVQSMLANMVLLFVFVFTSLLVSFYLILNRKFNYWQKKNVPYAKPLPFVGNYGEFIFLKKWNGTVAQELCKHYSEEPYFGTFYGTEPALIVKDPQILKLVFTKDFSYFYGREVTDYTHKELITQNMFFNSGDSWKVVRQNLTPMFSSAKMKSMFYLIQKCNDSFAKMLDREFSVSNIQGAGSLTSRYTMDCLCTCVFGLESKTMDEDTTANPFRLMAEVIYNTSRYRGFKLLARAMWPRIFYGLGFKTFPKSIGDFFQELLKGVFDHRQYQPTQRHDFVDQLLNLKQEDYLTVDSMNNIRTGGNEKVLVKVDDDLLVAQCVLFFSAGFDTSATTLCFTLYEFAKNPDTQEKAITEVEEYLRRQEGKLDYNCLTELRYLEACVHETMRLYPIFGLLTRELMDNYTFPTGLCVERGMRIHIPLYHLHHDPKNFPDPEDFMPERFMPDAVHEIKPYTYCVENELVEITLAVESIFGSQVL